MFGIIRSLGAEEKIAVFVPAATGTRIGPQRLYVQVSEHFIKAGVATLCLDLPIHGDGFGLKKESNAGNGEKGFIAFYEENLLAVDSFLRKNYYFKEIIPVSISYGCIPVLAFAQKMQYPRAVLLSPNHRFDEVEGVNTKNLRAYRLKLFTATTWKKVLAMDVNYWKVIDNIFNFSERKSKKRMAHGKRSGQSRHHCYDRVNVLCVFGEKDPAIGEHNEFWNQLYHRGQIRTLKMETVAGADHSFFGWDWKESLGEIVYKWLK